MRKPKYLILALSLAATSLAWAGSGTGLVTGFVTGISNGTVVFLLSTQAQSNTPSCNTTQRFAMSANDPRYKETVAGVMSAQASGTPVYAVGLGTCTYLTNSEDLSYVCVGGIAC